MKNKKNDIINLKLNKYNHYIIEEKILRDLRTKLNKTNINIIETRQFVLSYKLLNSLMK